MYINLVIDQSNESILILTQLKIPDTCLWYIYLYVIFAWRNMQNGIAFFIFPIQYSSFQLHDNLYGKLPWASQLGIEEPRTVHIRLQYAVQSHF